MLLATPHPCPNSIDSPPRSLPPSSELNDLLNEALKLASLVPPLKATSKKAKRSNCLPLALRGISLSLLTDVPHAAD